MSGCLDPMGLASRARWKPIRRLPARGQALVETALILPVFLLVLFGLIDAGRLAFTNSMVSQAAREGARVAAVQARWIGQTAANDPACVPSASNITAANPGAHVCPADVPTLRANVRTAINGELFGAGNIPLTSVYLSCDLALSGAPTGSWTTATCVNNSSGNLVSVRTILTYRPITPIVSSLLRSIDLTGAATMVIN